MKPTTEEMMSAIEEACEQIDKYNREIAKVVFYINARTLIEQVEDDAAHRQWQLLGLVFNIQTSRYVPLGQLYKINHDELEVV